MTDLDIEAVRESLMTAMLQLTCIHSADPAIEATLTSLKGLQRNILDEFNAVMP